MVYTIDKYIPTNELQLIFDYIDQEKKGTINASNLKKMLS
jgi:Ca2+-binding EF-hand superfamily protein